MPSRIAPREDAAALVAERQGRALAVGNAQGQDAGRRQRPDLRRDRRYEHELIVWAAEQVRGGFRETSWRAFWATQIEGKPVAEVARELGVSPGSIHMSLNRIFVRIREKIGEVM